METAIFPLLHVLPHQPLFTSRYENAVQRLQLLLSICEDTRKEAVGADVPLFIFFFLFINLLLRNKGEETKHF